MIIEITKKELKMFNELNKKVKSYFPTEYYIFPYGVIFGKDENGSIDEHNIIITDSERCDVIRKCVSENHVLKIYTEILYDIYKTSSKIKSKDIGEPYMDEDNELIVPIFGNPIVIGKLVHFNKVNLERFRRIAQITKDDIYSAGIILSEEQYKALYNKEKIEVDFSDDSNDYKLILNRKIFKGFSQYTKNGKIECNAYNINKDLFRVRLSFVIRDKDDEDNCEILSDATCCII